MGFAKKNNLDFETIEKFMIEVDRLKSCGNHSDREILGIAYRKVVNNIFNNQDEKTNK